LADVEEQHRQHVPLTRVPDVEPGSAGHDLDGTQHPQFHHDRPSLSSGLADRRRPYKVCSRFSERSRRTVTAPNTEREEL
jgi:hypothetical protein